MLNVALTRNVKDILKNENIEKVQLSFENEWNFMYLNKFSFKAEKLEIKYFGTIGFCSFEKPNINTEY